MNEEIVARLGMDTSPFASGIRTGKSLLKDLKDDAKGVGELFKKAFELAGIALTLSMLKEAGMALLEFGDHINSVKDATGATTDLIQQFNYAARHTGTDSETAEKGLSKLSLRIGEARSGSAEAVEMFKKLGISLSDAAGNALTVDQVVDSAAQRIRQIEDPTQRAALAFELFGKGGQKLIAALTDLDKFKAESKSLIVSERDLDLLNSAEERSKGLWENMKAIGAKGLAPALVVFGLADPNAGLKKFVADLKNKTTPEEFDPKTTKEYIGALAALNKAKQDANFKGLDDQLKLASLRYAEFDLERQINALQGDSVEKLKMQKDLVEKQGEIARLRQGVEKKFNEDNAKKNADLLRTQEKQLALAREIAHATEARDKSADELAAAKGNGAQYSLKELADSQFTFGGALGQDQGIADQIARLQQAIAFDKAHGNIDNVKAGLSDIDRLRHGLSSNVTEEDRNPYKALEERVKEGNEHLKEIAAKAAGEGIKVVPVYGAAKPNGAGGKT